MAPTKILVVADVPDWAWGAKARQYRRYLNGDEFSVTIAYSTQGLPDPNEYSLVHLFEVSQLGYVPTDYQGVLIAGLTAHVWPTWGSERMLAWAARCSALHGNSLLLVQELRAFHPKVYYTPNGVDTKFWVRKTPLTESTPVVACHVGKPNPRKGSAAIIAACEIAKVPLRLVQRTSHVRLTPEVLRDEFYSESSVQVTMSDMDGTPNPMLEAASCGNALISTRIGNMPEFIESWNDRDAELPNGFLIERSVEVLAAKLSWLRERPNIVKTMGNNARREALSWDWEFQVKYVSEMWRGLLSER